ncbi:MAG TPA: glycosyltransferase family 39 protein, partial [Thermoanaerobaculia bacterium]|nr:glycosyltransferase family 39 protein [Thermoanaerobaculia bacterium]
MGIGLSLTVVFALQIAATRDRLAGPFLDTRLHYGYDNALYGFQIRNGLRDVDPRSQFGVTVAAYDRWGEATGRPTYYTDHPFLVKALLQLYARAAGVSEWTTRSFYLLVAAGTAAGLFAVLLPTTGSVFAAAAGAATLVSLPVFSVYQLCVKSEADGMLVAVWLYAAFVAALRRGTRGPRLEYAALAVAAFLTHWTAILFVGVLTAYELFLARRHREARRLLRTSAAASAAGLAVLLGLMSWLQRGWAGAREALMRSFGVRSQAIPLPEWGARQLLYAQKNFTVTAALLSLAMLGLLGARVVRLGGAPREEGDPSDEPAGLALLEGFVLVTAAVAVLWVGLFPQGSFVHVYWQYWFCLPIAALVAGTVAMAEGTRLRAPARVAACALVAALFVAARKEYAGIAADQLGTP